jgi:hypothetical protein
MSMAMARLIVIAGCDCRELSGSMRRGAVSLPELRECSTAWDMLKKCRMEGGTACGWQIFRGCLKGPCNLPFGHHVVIPAKGTFQTLV